MKWGTGWLTISAVGILLAQAPAHAQGLSTTLGNANTDFTNASFLSPLVKTIRERGKAAYTMWVTGPTVGDVDGKEGRGSDLTLNQFAMIGFKASSKWTISATQYWTNTTRETKPTERNLTFKDPYVSFTNASVTSSKRYGTNLLAQIRYYVPIAHESADSRGAAGDIRNGRVRLRVEPSQEFFDGLVNVKATTFFIKNLRSGTINEGLAAQRDAVLWLYPTVEVNVHQKFQPYVAYSNYYERWLDKNRAYEARWNRFNEKHNLEIGFNWQPAKGLNINPYLEYGPVFIPKASSLGLIAEYAFL